MRFLSRATTRKLGLAMAAAAALGLGGGAWLLHSGRADAALAAQDQRIVDVGARLGVRIESVAVEGRERESRQAILDALGATRGMPLLGFDLGAAKTRIEALPWVRAAEIERLLPDRLFIRIAERRPLAFWQRQGRLDLIADDGKVIAGAKLDDYGGLVVLVGEDAPKEGAPLLAMLATEPALMAHVAAAVRVGGRRWNVRLDSGIDVALPEDNAEDAWHRLAAIEKTDNVLDRAILAVDLRLPDRLVVRLPEAPKPAPKKGKPGGKPT